MSKGLSLGVAEREYSLSKGKLGLAVIAVSTQKSRHGG